MEEAFYYSRVAIVASLGAGINPAELFRCSARSPARDAADEAAVGAVATRCCPTGVHCPVGIQEVPGRSLGGTGVLRRHEVVVLRVVATDEGDETVGRRHVGGGRASAHA